MRRGGARRNARRAHFEQMAQSQVQPPDVKLGSVDLDAVEERGGVYAVEGGLKDKLKYFQSGATRQREGAEVARSDSRRQIRRVGRPQTEGEAAAPPRRVSRGQSSGPTINV